MLRQQKFREAGLFASKKPGRATGQHHPSGGCLLRYPHYLLRTNAAEHGHHESSGSPGQGPRADSDRILHAVDNKPVWERVPLAGYFDGR
ncbi:hypothetical protein C6366_15350 [Desulfonatronum sp. SC1]|nr:hypothetical protein C6366_15350 [Desulfonatronum sp. SC1]